MLIHRYKTISIKNGKKMGKNMGKWEKWEKCAFFHLHTWKNKNLKKSCKNAHFSHFSHFWEKYVKKLPPIFLYKI